jgi:L-amino acid N-acyltransferase YncA
VIRPATPADAPAVAAIYAPYVRDTAISFESEPPGPPEMASRIAGTLERFPYLVVEDSVAGGVIGYAYAGLHASRAAYRWSADVSVYIGPDGHRRGLGRRLYTALLALLEMQGYAHAYAGITLPNPASTGLHEALGFTAVGTYRNVGHKFGRWYDVVWYERPILGPVPGPAEPTAFPDLDPAQVSALLAGA